MEQFIPLILIAGFMYLILILPQQRRNREHRALLAGLEEGDEIVLNSGIHGFVSAIEGDILWLEVATDTELKVTKSSVAGKIEVPVVDADTVDADADEDS